jgi:predicted trehalose synthase
MDELLKSLTEWMPAQRWYTSKGRTPLLQLVGEWQLPGDVGTTVRLLLVADAASGDPVVYQVPIVERATAPESGVVGVRSDGTVLVDGAVDAAFGDWLYGAVCRGGAIAGTSGEITGVPAPSAPATAPTATAKVLGAEQSNTSLVFRPRGSGTAVICKIFRQVHPGLNPDIELQTALAAAGSSSVPAAIGSLEGGWRDPADEAHSIRGSLAFAQEFLPDVEDAWRVALEAAGSDDDFADRAEALGRAVADVHLSLRRVFPAPPTTEADQQRIAAVWEGRLAMAVEHIPALAATAPAIRSEYEAALAAPWPPLQRIHGDLHLGQVLEVAGRGWVVLDFEGEPLRPMSERRAPDVAARDVAGMLRSFDYVAGSVSQTRPEDPAVQRWAARAKEAFLRGYEAGGGGSADAALLRAFELDKAVYEAIYEVRNRPDWLPIPLAAIDRLTTR